MLRNRCEKCPKTLKFHQDRAPRGFPAFPRLKTPHAPSPHSVAPPGSHRACPNAPQHVAPAPHWLTWWSASPLLEIVIRTDCILEGRLRRLRGWRRKASGPSRRPAPCPAGPVSCQPYVLPAARGRGSAWPAGCPDVSCSWRLDSFVGGCAADLRIWHFL